MLDQQKPEAAAGTEVAPSLRAILPVQTGAVMNREYRGAVLVLTLLAGIVIAPCHAQIKEFSKWPAGTSPQEVGKRVAERFVANAQLSLTAPIYPTVCTWYGALNFAELSRDSELTTRLIQLFDTQLTPAVLDLVNQRRHVDFSVLGAVPLQIYIETKDKPYLATGTAIADRQWEHPTADGLSGETRFWIDDMFMITILQVQAYRATGDAKYLDRAALEMEAYLDRLQQPNGLFYHAPDTPYFWGRGNGWVAAGLTELLWSMPPDYPGARKNHGGIPEDDGRVAEAAGQGRHVAPTAGSSRSLAGDVVDGHVHLCDDHGREEWLARQENVRPGGAQGVAWAGQLHQRQWRCQKCL